MAAIDKIYGTTQEFLEFFEWCKKNKKSALPYFYYASNEHITNIRMKEWNDGKNHVISNFPKHIDVWMLNNCPLEFITKKIKEQYNMD